MILASGLVVAGVAGLLLFVLVRLNYIETGFAGKTIWDWLKVVAVPIAGFILGGVFAIVAQMAGRRAELERELATERERQEILQSYLIQMTQLMLSDALKSDSEGVAGRAVASALTFAALRMLDETRKGILVRFLHESQLIRRDGPTISMAFADLKGADLSSADLSGSDLGGAILIAADLKFANLSEANLYGADLTDANLYEANLTGADLTDAILDGAILTGA